MFYVYILQLKNKSYYVGFTSDLKTRIKDHNNGKSPYTKKFRPVKLVAYIAVLSKKKALDLESYLKAGSGMAFRNKRLI